MQTTTEAPALSPKRRNTRRRGNGEGSIFQRHDGRWVATITVGYADNGKRRRRDFYGWTKKEVQDKLTRVQTAKLDGMLAAPDKSTVGQFLDRWLEDAAKPTIRATTHACYKGIIGNHIKPKIGGMKLAGLSPVHVQALYAEMERGGASGYTRKQAHAVLHRALKQALKWGLVARNSCDAVDPPAVVKSKMHTLSADQVAKLFEAAIGERLEALYVVAVGTGLRLGELFGLQWPDVDLEAGMINVQRSLSEVNGRLTLGEPKTAKSRRQVDLPQEVVDALHAHRKRMLVEGHAAVEYVFCNSIGGPLRRSHFHAQHYKPLLAKAGLPAIRFHDLRHTSATLLLSAGVHPKVVQERLGHSNISMTMDTYSHVLPTMQKEAAGKMSGIFQAADARARVAAAAG